MAIEGEVKRALRGKQIISTVEKSSEGKVYKNSIILPVQSCVSEAWMHNVAQQLQVNKVEMNYINSTCSVSVWNGE